MSNGLQNPGEREREKTNEQLFLLPQAAFVSANASSEVTGSNIWTGSVGTDGGQIEQNQTNDMQLKLVKHLSSVATV